MGYGAIVQLSFYRIKVKCVNLILNLVKFVTLCAVEEVEVVVLVVLGGTRETMTVDMIVAMTEAVIAMTTEMATDLTGQLRATFLHMHISKTVCSDILL